MDQNSKRLYFQGGQRSSLGESRLLTLSSPLCLVRPVGISEKSQGSCPGWSLQGRGRGSSSRLALVTLEQQNQDSSMGLEGRPACPSRLGQRSSRREPDFYIRVLSHSFKPGVHFPVRGLYHLFPSGTFRGGEGQKPPGQGTRLGPGSKVWHPNQRPICHCPIHVSIYSKEKFLSELNMFLLKSW